VLQYGVAAGEMVEPLPYPRREIIQEPITSRSQKPQENVVIPPISSTPDEAEAPTIR
jgi:hypothetical protein